MKVKRIRHARVRMRIMEQTSAYRYVVAGIRQLVAWPGWSNVWVQRIGLAIVLPILIFIITVPLDVQGQFVFGSMCFAAVYMLRNVPGRYISQVLIVMSLMASTRYMYWRITETMEFRTWDNAFFGSGLFLAEMYAWVVLVLGYLQSAWPLERKPMPLPKDTSQWPTVDILIPTYNESLSVVRNTVCAAMGIDWPKDKIRVLILDDGRRNEFKEFAAEVGVEHVTRADNKHAKAGNINAALKNLTGDYVAIFDCDHIPTRSFLQVCMGWFLVDEKLVMIQTPHHFYSPDPFEKNLRTFKKVPNEGELFYGLLQDGNDLWNATFFCGSCAIIKRGPLNEVGGIAVETVTEDAHTALKLHRLGYSTAYLAIPLAAGFATESLSGHVGQRIRWARGMAQIFRVDNPLLGKGLKLMQRFCYVNAMAHFFYGIPRLVFLTAPLAYLIFGSEVIQASAVTIAVFVLPHLLHANLTNSRLQGEFRHSFWAEVYETVLAWYILRPTLVAVINPKLGKFNVTAKGGINDNTYFDWGIAKPYLLLMILNGIGVMFGLYHIFFDPEISLETMALNLIWVLYSFMMLGASAAVANEAKQVRATHRVTMSLPAAVRCENGKSLSCTTTDYSEGGLGLKFPGDVELVAGEKVKLGLFRGKYEHEFDAEVTLVRGDSVGLKLATMTAKQTISFVQATFGRADSWVTWADKRKMDKPLVSLKHVFRMGMVGLKLLINLLGELVRERVKVLTVRKSVTTDAVGQ